MRGRRGGCRSASAAIYGGSGSHEVCAARLHFMRARDKMSRKSGGSVECPSFPNTRACICVCTLWRCGCEGRFEEERSGFGFFEVDWLTLRVSAGFVFACFETSLLRSLVFSDPRSCVRCERMYVSEWLARIRLRWWRYVTKFCISRCCVTLVNLFCTHCS